MEDSSVGVVHLDGHFTSCYLQQPSFYLLQGAGQESFVEDGSEEKTIYLLYKSHFLISVSF